MSRHRLWKRCHTSVRPSVLTDLVTDLVSDTRVPPGALGHPEEADGAALTLAIVEETRAYRAGRRGT